MKRSLRLPTLAAVLLLAACSREPAPAGPAPAAPDVAAAPATDAENFERTWLGVLPCADCDGIQTRLQLVREGDAQTYELEETYLGAGEGETVFTQNGRWV